MKKLIIPCLLVLFFFTACEEQMVVIPDNPPPSDRKILIEEFTGANCSACPQGAAAIKDFASIYPGNIIAVAIHTEDAGTLGEPLSESKYDLRTPAGSSILSHLGQLAAIPTASINRKKFAGQGSLLISPFTAWAEHVGNEIGIAPEVTLGASASFDSDTRALNVEATIIPQSDVSGDIRIVAYITESHIVDKQLNGTEVVSNYENNHILRHALTEVSGESLVNGTMPALEVVKKEFDTFTLPAEDGTWIAENCHVVVFVTRFDAANDSREVLQAFEVDFVQ